MGIVLSVIAVIVIIINIYLIPTFPTIQEKALFLAVEVAVVVFSFVFNILLDRWS